MPAVKINKSVVDGAEARDCDQFLWDTALKGFGLKITKGGRKIYVLQYRMGGSASPVQRYTIGQHGSPWTPSGARSEAERLLLNIAGGVDVQREKKKQLAADDDQFLVRRYVERYLEDHGRRQWRPRTWSSVESNLRRHVIPVLGEKTIQSIARADLIRVRDKLPASSPALPRNLHAHLRKMFSWALERGDIAWSPFEGLKSPASVASRNRVLADDELTAVWRATDYLVEPFGSLIRVLILSGQRRNEVASLVWSELNRKDRRWLLPANRAKNNCEHWIPLSEALIHEFDLLAGGETWPRTGLIFSTTGETAVSGFSKVKLALDATIESEAGEALATWRIHDLRRTLATGFQRLGVRLEVTEALLNHVSGSRGGIVGVYQLHDWKDEKREAIERWNVFIRLLNAEVENALQDAKACDLGDLNGRL